MKNNKIISFKIYRLGYPIEVLDVRNVKDIGRLYGEINSDEDVMKIDFVYGENDEDNK